MGETVKRISRIKSFGEKDAKNFSSAFITETGKKLTGKMSL